MIKTGPLKFGHQNLLYTEWSYTTWNLSNSVNNEINIPIKKFLYLILLIDSVERKKKKKENQVSFVLHCSKNVIPPLSHSKTVLLSVHE